MKHSIKLITIFLITVLSVGSLNAQYGTKALKIGDKVPNIPFEFFDADSIILKGQLSDYKGKLVILDFWASWCWSCLSKFPYMDTLQREFGDKIKVIMVNSKMKDGANGLKYIMKEKAEKEWPYGFSVALNDTIADAFFPSRFIPHYVWIGPAGRVVAITGSKEVTKDNIRKILNDENVNISLKKDLLPGILPSSVDININNELFSYCLFKKGKINFVENEGVSVADFIKVINDEGKMIPCGYRMRNIPLVEMYKIAIEPASYTLFGFGRWPDNRTILDVDDTSKLSYYYNVDTSRPGFYYEYGYYNLTTKNENFYTYEMILPEKDRDSSNKIYNCILNDLNKYSGYNGKIEKRKVKCLILQEVKGKKMMGFKKRDIYGGQHGSIEGNHKQYFTNSTFAWAFSFLNRNRNIVLPVICEVDVQSADAIDLVVDLRKLSASSYVNYLNDLLKGYNLELKEGIRELDMLVIGDNLLQKQSEIDAKAFNIKNNNN